MTDEELLRYSRHLLLPEVDVLGQEKIRNAHVLIVGLGGLGSPVALYLAAAGVGRFTLIDEDQVELTNLQRQIAHATSDIGQSKVESAKASMLALNPHVHIDLIRQRADVDLLKNQLANVDAVVECSDNMKLRYDLNQACVECNVPWVSGAAIGLSGQVIVFDSNKKASPCYACLYPDMLENEQRCDGSGVLSPVVGVVGAMQAVELLRLLVDFGESQVGRLMLWDAYSSNWQKISISKADNCTKCLI